MTIKVRVVVIKTVIRVRNYKLVLVWLTAQCVGGEWAAKENMYRSSSGSSSAAGNEALAANHNNHRHQLDTSIGMDLLYIFIVDTWINSDTFNRARD